MDSLEVPGALLSRRQLQGRGASRDHDEAQRDPSGVGTAQAEAAAQVARALLDGGPASQIYF